MKLCKCIVTHFKRMQQRKQIQILQNIKFRTGL